MPSMTHFEVCRKNLDGLKKSIGKLISTLSGHSRLLWKPKFHGRFQWAKCQLDQICYLGTDQERRQALETLLLDLFETYRRILSRINKSMQRRLVERVFKMAGVRQQLIDFEWGQGCSGDCYQRMHSDWRRHSRRGKHPFWCSSLVALNQKK